MQQYEALSNIPGAESLDPSLFAPPACHEAVAKTLTEQSGGTYSRASIPSEEEVTDAAVSIGAHTFAVGAAVIGSILLVV